jgi:hypothetical protein
VHRLKPEEKWAQQLIAHELSVPVEQNDDGSRPGMFDLRIRYPSGGCAAVEITAATASDSVELWKLMNGQSRRWQVEKLRGGWLISVLPSASDKRLLAELPGFLHELERLGIRDFEPSLAGDGPLRDLADSMGVASARQSRDTSYPGSVYRTIEEPLEHRAGFVTADGNPLAEWTGRFLADSKQADVLRKLKLASVVARHAFVVVPGFTTAPFAVRDLLWRNDAPLPTADPELPAPLTHAWVASTWSSGVGFRWDPAQGWASFQKTPKDPRNLGSTRFRIRLRMQVPVAPPPSGPHVAHDAV